MISFKTTMYPPFIFVKKIMFHWRFDVDVRDDVNTTKAIRRVNDKMF